MVERHNIDLTRFALEEALHDLYIRKVHSPFLSEVIQDALAFEKAGDSCPSKGAKQTSEF